MRYSIPNALYIMSYSLKLNIGYLLFFSLCSTNNKILLFVSEDIFFFCLKIIVKHAFGLLSVVNLKGAQLLRIGFIDKPSYFPNFFVHCFI